MRQNRIALSVNARRQRNRQNEVCFFDRGNEACLCRESGLYEIVEKPNEYPKTSLGCSSSRAGCQGHAKRN